MAIVSKKKNVASTPATTTVKKTVTAPVKKTVEEVEAPVVEKKTTAKGGKKMTLTGNTKTPKTFEIKEGTQATQEAFIDKFYKKIIANGWDITKEQAKSLKKAYSETLKEVTDIASYQDVDAGMYYARRYIETRVTQPPKAKDGLKTLMAGHYELKVRKVLGNEEDFKFFGDLNEDGTIFITKDGDEIAIGNEEVEVKPVTKKVAPKKVAVEEEVIEEDEDEEEEVVEEEIEEEVDETEEDDEFDDFLDDDDE